jgi:hypothetical protein
MFVAVVQDLSKAKSGAGNLERPTAGKRALGK